MISSLQMVMYVSIEQFKIGMQAHITYALSLQTLNTKSCIFFKNRNTQQF